MLQQLYVSESTMARLKAISEEKGRDITDLMRSAIDEACLDYFRGRNDDPANQRPGKS